MNNKKVRHGKAKLRSISVHLRRARLHISELQGLERHLRKLLSDRSFRNVAVTKLKRELKRAVDLIRKDYTSLKSSKGQYLERKVKLIETKLKKLLSKRTKAFKAYQ